LRQNSEYLTVSHDEVHFYTFYTATKIFVSVGLKNTAVRTKSGSHFFFGRDTVVRT
jgi:hypothetical protein